MPDLTRNHPAVEAALNEHMANATRHATGSQKVRAVLRAALPHLTADDLRDTPAGQALMAEAKREAAYELECMAESHDWAGRTEAATAHRATARALLAAYPEETP